MLSKKLARLGLADARRPEQEHRRKWPARETQPAKAALQERANFAQRLSLAEDVGRKEIPKRPETGKQIRGNECVQILSLQVSWQFVLALQRDNRAKGL